MNSPYRIHVDNVSLRYFTPQGETLEAVYEKATAPTPNYPGRKITYKLLRPDFFVVTGETPTGKFYRRLAAGRGLEQS